MIGDRKCEEKERKTKGRIEGKIKERKRQIEKDEGKGWRK